MGSSPDGTIYEPHKEAVEFALKALIQGYLLLNLRQYNSPIDEDMIPDAGDLCFVSASLFVEAVVHITTKAPKLFRGKTRKKYE